MRSCVHHKKTFGMDARTRTTFHDAANSPSAEIVAAAWLVIQAFSGRVLEPRRSVNVVSVILTLTLGVLQLNLTDRHYGWWGARCGRFPGHKGRGM